MFVPFALTLGLIVATGADDTPRPARTPPQRTAPAPAAPTAPTQPAARTDPAAAEALARVLRQLLQGNVPDPLVQTHQDWGRQVAVTVTRRYRDGLRVWTEPLRELRNDGHWRRLTVRVPRPDQITLAVTELVPTRPGCWRVTVGVTAERVDLRFEQQLWRNGLRLYSGETRAHCRGGLLLTAEVVVRTHYPKGALLPEVTVRVRATEARIVYENLVVDHTAGLGGDAAKALGEMLLRAVKAFQPDLERELLTRANEAVVKAAGTREFKASLDRLLRGKD